MNILFHVGWPKTGTTALQKWCSENEKQLLERGVLYPSTGRFALGSHNRLAFSLGNDTIHSCPEQADALWTQLIREIREVSSNHRLRTIFISAETMPPLYRHKDILERFRPLTEKLSILTVIREQQSMIQSAYAAFVCDPHLRSTLRFPDFLEQHKQSFLYHHPLRLYRDGYPWEDFHVLAYSKNIVCEVLDLLSVRDLMSELPARENVSPAPESVEAIRVLNLIDMPFKKRARLNRLAQETPANFNLSKPWLSPEKSSELMKYYSESNACVLEEFGVNLACI